MVLPPEAAGRGEEADSGDGRPLGEEDSDGEESEGDGIKEWMNSPIPG